MTSVCNGMLLKFFLNKFSFLSSIGSDFKISILIFFAKFNGCVPKHRDFLISVFQNTEIQKSPCFGTWRLNFV